MKKAFTIIETMIALIIFWVWILVILVVLNKNVLLSKQIELKTKATMIAKEWMEIVFNKRDSNNIKYQPWNYITWDLTIQNNPNITYFETWTDYKVWTDFSWYENHIEKINFPYVISSKLYIKTWEILDSAWEVVYSWFYYNYQTWEKTTFSRYVMFTWAYLLPEWNNLNPNIMKINSIVKYKFGWITWDIVLESLISNWK